jgi:hypothetical protein
MPRRRLGPFEAFGTSLLRWLLLMDSTRLYHSRQRVRQIPRAIVAVAKPAGAANSTATSFRPEKFYISPSAA